MTARSALRVTAASWVIALAGCQADVLYENDFEGEQPGATPASHPPGVPSGDRTHVHPSPHPDFVQVGVPAQAGADSIDGQSLVLRAPEEVGQERAVRFITDEVGDPNRKKRFRWRGLMTASEPLFCNVAAAVMQASDSLPRSGAIGTLVLELEAGAVSASAGSGMEVLGGYTPGAIHEATIIWDPKDGEVELTVEEASGTVLSHSGPGLRSAVAAAGAASRLMLQCRLLYIPGTDPSGFYVMDDVRIEED